MKIHVVTHGSWICSFIAQRTINNCTIPDIEFSLGSSLDRNANINYYVDQQVFEVENKVNNLCQITYYSHAHESSKTWLVNKFNEINGWALNGIVSMNKRYTDMLIEVGYDQSRITTLVPGETKDNFPLKKTKIGIVSRGGYPGYGQQFLEHFFATYNHQLSNFKFKFLGNGWDNIRNVANHYNVDVELLPDTDYSIYPSFYDSIDYQLIPGLWTAGPMSMQEALASGVPIIGADVGFVNYEFKADYVFPPGDGNTLFQILKKIEEPKIERRNQVKDMTWTKYSNDVINFCLDIYKRDYR
jgi:glycosyltransferase involved in cell wall biosynthesis